jgi:hypothetical protein
MPAFNIVKYKAGDIRWQRISVLLTIYRARRNNPNLSPADLFAELAEKALNEEVEE